MAEDDTNFWRMTSIGLVIAALVAVVTGIVVANRTGRVVANRIGPADASLDAPSASPATTIERKVVQAPEPASAAPSQRMPPPSVVAECNRVAAGTGGPERTRSEKTLSVAKDGGAGTLYGIHDDKKHDERYRSEYVGCMKSRGYTA